MKKINNNNYYKKILIMKFLILIFIILLINFIFTNILTSNPTNAQINRESTENSINNTNKLENETPIIVYSTHSLNETTIKAISNSLNETTIKAISNSLNETTNRLISSLIQSINSSISKTSDQRDYTAISAYAAGGSAIVAAISATILLKSFLSQNKLIKSEIKQHNVFLRNQRELHYEKVKIILEKVTSRNLDVFNSTLKPIDFITSLKFNYKIEDIKNIIEKNIAGIHLKNDYPKFDTDLEEIKQLINDLNNKISNFESQISKTVKQRLSNFDLIEELGKPIILTNYLYNYWFDKFKLFENNSNPDQFDLKFRGIKKDYGGHFDSDYYLFGGQGVFRKSTSKSNDENEFLFLVNNLVTSKEIWKMIEEIAILRNQIKDKIKHCNKKVEKIIIQIDQNEYNKIYKCCL